MHKKTKMTVALLSVVAVGALTQVSFAATSGVTAVTIAGGSSTFAAVTAATTDGAHGATPSWDVTPGAAGSITAGDLYAIDTGAYTGDILVTIYVTNVADLAQRYTYLNLGVTAYEWDSTLASGAGDWETTPIAGKTGSSLTSYLTLTGGYVSFVLPQDAEGGKFSLSVDGGSFYANSQTSGGSISPEFFVDVRQA